MEKTVVKYFLAVKKALNVQAWVIESAFVLTVLLSTAILSGKGWVEYIAVAAVYFTFKHASVSERLAEANAANSRKSNAETVECAPKLQRFFLLKEILWVAFFALSGAWSALAGCAVFLLYAWWRKAYRRYHPRAAKGAVKRHFVRHFKYNGQEGIAGTYEVLGQSEHTEEGKIMVLYRPCYKRPNIEETETLCRTFENFWENVREGVSRFTPITDPNDIEACVKATDLIYN